MTDLSNELNQSGRENAVSTLGVIEQQFGKHTALAFGEGMIFGVLTALVRLHGAPAVHEMLKFHFEGMTRARAEAEAQTEAAQRAAAEPGRQLQ